MLPPHSQISRAPPTVRGTSVCSHHRPVLSGQTPASSLRRQDAHMDNPSKNEAKTSNVSHRRGLGARWVRPHPTPALDTLSALNTSPRRPVDRRAHLQGPQGLSTRQVSAHSPGKTLSATFTSDAPPEMAAFPPRPWAPDSCCVHCPASPDPRAPDSEPPSLPAPPLPSPQPP